MNGQAQRARHTVVAQLEADTTVVIDALAGDMRRIIQALDVERTVRQGVEARLAAIEVKHRAFQHATQTFRGRLSWLWNAQ